MESNKQGGQNQPQPELEYQAHFGRQTAVGARGNFAVVIGKADETASQGHRDYRKSGAARSRPPFDIEDAVERFPRRMTAGHQRAADDSSRFMNGEYI